jgi:AAA ATPase domain
VDQFLKIRTAPGCPDVVVGSGRRRADPPDEQDPMTKYGDSRVRVQRAWATVGSMIVQVGDDLYVSDPGLPAQWTADPGQCPYPGLEAFRSGQAGWFFGRERLTGDLLDRLEASVFSGGPVLLVGPSGVGKSSLLGAGLLTALEQGWLPVPGSEKWPRLMFTPGARPLEMLADALATCADALVGWQVPGRGTGGWDAAFLALRAALRENRAPARRVVIVVDQLEEIFTACRDEAERREFLDALCAIATDKGNGPVGLVVLGLRADFYARATEHQALWPALQGGQIVIGAMTATELRQAILRPAQATGLTLEDGLTERLLSDLGADSCPPGEACYEPGLLPALAHALRATWQRRDGDRLTIAGYQAAGGIHGAIALTAEDVYASLGGPAHRGTRADDNGSDGTPAGGAGVAGAGASSSVAGGTLSGVTGGGAGSVTGGGAGSVTGGGAGSVTGGGAGGAAQQAARQMFLQFVRVGEAADETGGTGTADTCRRVTRDSLRTTDAAATRAALDAFTAARLLTSGGQTVEITHEALLRHWPRLRDWIGWERAGQLIHQNLEDAAVAWDRAGRDPSGLDGGIRLAAAHAWADDPARPRDLSPVARDYLAAAALHQRRSIGWRNSIIAVLAALSVGLAVLAAFAAR